MAGHDDFGLPVITPKPMKWWERILAATLVAIIVGALLLLAYIY